MTSEQIAELRALNRIATEGSSPAFTVSVYVPHPMLARLLDEREALLAALKKVAWGGSFHSETDLCCSCRASRDEDHGPACVVQAAIAKAEAP